MWHAVADQIRPYILRIQTRQKVGTGFICRKIPQAQLTVIITAGHVVDDCDHSSDPISFLHVSSGSLGLYQPGHWRKFHAKTGDHAVIIIKGSENFLPDQELGTLDDSVFVKQGREVGWFGFPRIFPTTLCFFSGIIAAYQEEKGIYIIDGSGIHGLSGGPVFHNNLDRTSIIGILTEYHPNFTDTGPFPGLVVAHDLSFLKEPLEQVKTFEDAVHRISTAMPH